MVPVMALDLIERVIEELRACRSSADLVALDERFAGAKSDKSLHRLICDGLRDRSIAPVEAARWLAALMDHRNRQLTECLHMSCQL